MDVGGQGLVETNAIAADVTDRIILKSCVFQSAQSRRS